MSVLTRLKNWVLDVFGLRETKLCPSCEVSWTGQYPRKYMDYCHHCGEELVEP